MLGTILCGLVILVGAQLPFGEHQNFSAKFHRHKSVSPNDAAEFIGGVLNYDYERGEMSFSYPGFGLVEHFKFNGEVCLVKNLGGWWPRIFGGEGLEDFQVSRFLW